jgi:hypothetical protein
MNCIYEDRYNHCLVHLPYALCAEWEGGVEEIKLKSKLYCEDN